MAAGGAAPTGAESVPARAAAVSEKFRIITGAAKPVMQWFRSPVAEGTANAAEVGRPIGKTACFRNNFPRGGILLQKKKRRGASRQRPSYCRSRAN